MKPFRCSIADGNQQLPPFNHLIRSQQQRADIAERVIEQQAARAGKPQLVCELQQARQNIAKILDVERAMNLAEGNVDARSLGRALDRGAPRRVSSRRSRDSPKPSRS
jgi:hypothetical protein